MPEADGSITIDTTVDDSGLRAGSKEIEASAKRLAASVDGIGKKAKIALQKQVDSFTKLNQQYAQQEKKVDDLKRKVQEYANQKIPTEEYREIQEQIDKASVKMNNLINKQQKFIDMGGSTNSRSYKSMQYDIDELANTIRYAKGELTDLEQSGKAFSFGVNTENAKRDMQKLSTESEKLKNMNNRLGTSYASIKEKVDSYRKKLLGLNASTGKTEKSTRSLNKSLNNTGKQARSAQYGMGRMLASSLMFSMVFRAISAVTNGMKEGLTNLAQYSGRTNASISMILSSLSGLKNAFATAFAPILNVVAPILSKFIDMISVAATYVSMFFSALTGKDTFTKAIPVQKDYAASLKDTADSAGDAADATNDAKKAVDRYLSGIDEINKYSDGKDSSSGGGSSLPKPELPGGVNPSDMFETIPIENGMKDLVNNVKKVFEQVFTPFKEAWEREGKATIDAAQSALKNVGSLAKSVGKSLMEVWTNGTGTEILSTMLQIAQNVLKVIGNIAKQLEVAWNKNKVGTAIIQAIADAVQIILNFVNKIVDATAEWAGNLDFYPLLESIKNLLEAINPVIEEIGNFLYDVYTTIILPMLTWLIETAIPAVINWVSKLFDFLGKNKWIIDVVGSALIGAFAAAKIVPAIVKIVGSIKTLTGGISTVVKAITGAKGLKSAISAVTALLGGSGGGLALAIGAVIAAGVALIANWDDVKKWGKDTWTKVSTWVSNSCKKAGKEIEKKWGEIKRWLGDVWDRVEEKAHNAFEAVSYTVKDACNKAKNFTTSIWGNIQSWASNTWDSMRVKAASVFDNIKSNISNAWNNTKSFTTNIWGNIRTWASNTWDSMKVKADTVFNGIKEKISNAWNNAKSFTTSTWNTIKSSVTSTWNSISTTASSKFSGIASSVSNAWNKAKASTSSIWATISKTVSSVWNNMVGTAKSVGNRIASGITSGLRSLPGTLYNLGRNAISSLISGINSLVSKAWSSIRNFTSSVSNSISNVFRRRSSVMVSTPVSPYTAVPASARIPYLASGAVIPPRAEFLAVLGDQKHGNNIEAPENLLRRIVREETGTKTGGNIYKVDASVGRRTLFEVIIEEAKLQQASTGRNPFSLA